jgi:hypothetical protein
MRFDLEDEFFDPVNPIDLVVNFSLPHSMPQPEFRIKYYSRLKLRWSDFNFYFFYLSSSFFLLSLCLSSLFLYMKIIDKELIIGGILVRIDEIGNP